MAVGATGRLDERQATESIAGFTVANNVSARDWQTRTEEWMQGKTFEATTPLGPRLVTLDEAGQDPEIIREVDGETMQHADTAVLRLPNPHPRTGRCHPRRNPRRSRVRPHTATVAGRPRAGGHADQWHRRVPQSVPAAMTYDDPAIHFLGRTLSRAQVDAAAVAVAGILADRGVGRGDRVLLFLQNMPQSAIACQAIWRLNAIAVPVNPMYKAGELSRIAQDCRPSAAIVLDDLYSGVVQPALVDYDEIPVYTTSALDYCDLAVANDLGLRRALGASGCDLGQLISAHAEASRPLSREECPPDDVAALVYTSGTTGPPKGAMIRHRHLTAEVDLWRDVYDLGPGAGIMGVAPFFHITGLAADLVVALDTETPLVQSYRFDPSLALRWIECYRPTSMVAAITAYTALLNRPELTAAAVSSLRTCLSGGAPVAAATVERWQERTGHYIRNCYGLTETTSLTTLTPRDLPAPVDPSSGALSVGKAVGDTRVRIVDEGGLPLPSGEVGEVVIDGPQVIDGYWEKDEETAMAIRGGVVYTGDVGMLDEQGWLYLVDRRKDLIVASGYKVWPREVEDVLIEHPSVAEAGVVGVPDEYRGEQVIAFVALRSGLTADALELVDFCRERLAVYKAPRRIHVLPELPKTATGKILRRELRSQGSADHLGSTVDSAPSHTARLAD